VSGRRGLAKKLPLNSEQHGPKLEARALHVTSLHFKQSRYIHTDRGPPVAFLPIVAATANLSNNALFIYVRRGQCEKVASWQRLGFTQGARTS
jgi:uncharacterized protein YdiU (UPF0061 family)